jgi:hypothetical protein
VRTFHKIAGAILALQLVLWTLTGFLFNYKYRYDEAYEPLKPAPAARESTGAWVSPADAARSAGVDPAAVRRVEMLHDHRGTLYVLATGTESAPQFTLASATTGAPVAPLDASGATAALRSALEASPNRDRYGTVTATRQLTAPSAALGTATPAWELDLDTGQTITVNAVTAEISHTALLNSWIDWTYRIHYMQYTPWKPVNITIVVGFSLLLLSLVTSGLRMLLSADRPRALFGRRSYSKGPKLRF